ncbi:trypsin [Scaptodrosophila lebanonensis]|uniref:Trypsin n=1 Tax=Drosophila lebanonensis TaxID=7225 RepID=A0A6J2TPF4_DROLE|nr:trypsin [Scaptodrosophila lebanonensis]
MNRLLLNLAALLVCGVCCLAMPQKDPFGRVVGGVATTIEDHPYQVSIQYTSGSHFCGGSLIDEETVVTAAHCLQGTAANEIQIRLGSANRKSGGELVSVRALTYHAGYNSKLMINDVALIKLSTPVRLTATIRPIALAEVTPPSGTPAVTSGWGTTCFLFCSSVDNLLEVEVDLLQVNECAQYNYSAGSILETMVCGYSEGKDACQGDSGGPLVANSQLVGIVSWGNGCAKSGYPGVYADVASLRSWIVATSSTL